MCDLYSAPYENLNDMMISMFGRKTYALYPFRSVLSETDGVCCTMSRCGSRLVPSQVSVYDIVSAPADYTGFGLYGPPTRAGDVVYALSSHSGRKWSSVVYPRCEQRLSELAMKWLSAPMPETWLLSVDRWSSSNPMVPLDWLKPNVFGAQRLNEDFVCYLTLSVCDEGTSRFEFLWDAQRFHTQLKRLNSLSDNQIYSRTSRPALMFRRADKRVLVVLDGTYYRDTPPSEVKSLANLHADFIAVLSSIYAVDMEPNEFATLLCTWFVYAFTSACTIPVSRRTSALLSMDMLARVPSELRALFIPLLRAYPEFDLDRIKGSAEWYQVDDMCYPHLPDRVLGSHVQLYDALRVFAAQLGIQSPESPSPDGYGRLFSALRSI